jgi:DEAD/DEAH box helicase domain-containing protein
MADQYPAANISLYWLHRKALFCKLSDDHAQTIGIVDGESATWMTHPGAVYLHEAQQYFVEELNLEQHIVRLKKIESDYYTEPLRSTT